MGVPWVKLDSSIGTHDKILALLADQSGRKWQAYASYLTAIAWSGGHQTDGFVPAHALGFVHGTPATARLLVKYKLWTEDLAGWSIVNYASHQKMILAEQLSEGGKKGMCSRWHGPDCWIKGVGCSEMVHNGRTY